MKLLHNTLIRGVVIGGLAMMAGTQPGVAQTTGTSAGGSDLQLIQEWDKTFPQSDRVEHRKVTFTNRYGITLAADLYMPRERGTHPLPALAISGPFGAVKDRKSVV